MADGQYKDLIYLHMLKTRLPGEDEKFMRLTLWKEQDKGPWVVLRYTCMRFGDQAAAAGLELAKPETASSGGPSTQAQPPRYTTKCTWMTDLWLLEAGPSSRP